LGAVYFYHLTRESVEAALPKLLTAAGKAGWRVLVRGTDRTHLQRLDEALWLRPEEGFLPHGLAGGEWDAAQPVLLSDGEGRPNDAQCVMCIDGAGLEAEEAKTLARACIVFDGDNPTAVQFARGQWKALTGAGLEAQYWSQEDGPWVMKASAG
jgi:DNA polymerase-3 subunit chi